MTSKKRSNKIDPSTRTGRDMGQESSQPSRDSRSGKGSEYMAGRRSLAYELRESGGLSSGRLGLEILYLLPDDFVTFYTKLFHEALDEGLSNKGSSGGGGINSLGEELPAAVISKGRTGTVLGSDTRLQAQGSGKKYRNTGMTIRSERALRVKSTVDKALQELTQDAIRSLRRGIREESAVRSGSNGSNAFRPASTIQGVGESTRSDSLPGTCHNRNCRKFLKDSWKFCPQCGESTKPGS